MTPDPIASQVYLALADARWEHAVALAEDNWPAMLPDHAPVLRAIAEAVPAELIADRPRWQELQQHLPYLLAAPSHRHERPPADPAWRRIADLTARSRAARVAGDIATAVESALAARDEFRRTLGRIEPPLTAPRLMFEWALAFLVGGPVPRAGWATEPEVQLDEVFSWAVAREDHEIASRAASEMAWLNAFAGRSESAALWVQRASVIRRANTGLALSAPPARLARSIRLSDTLDFAGAFELVAALSGDHLYDHRILVASTATMYAVHLGDGALDRARQELARVCATSAAGVLSAPMNAAVLAYAESYGHLFAQRPAQALQLLAPRPGIRLPLYAEARRASALLQLGDLHGAELSAMAALEEGGATPRFAVEAWAALAAVRLRTGSHDAAREAFGRAVELSDRNRLTQSLAMISSADHAALSGLIRGASDSPSLKALRRRRMQRPEHVEAPDPLTAQERRVLDAMAAGLSVPRAAAALDVSANTIKTQLRSIYRKLGVSRRADMIGVARQHGLL